MKTSHKKILKWGLLLDENVYIFYLGMCFENWKKSISFKGEVFLLFGLISLC